MHLTLRQAPERALRGRQLGETMSQWMKGSWEGEVFVGCGSRSSSDGIPGVESIRLDFSGKRSEAKFLSDSILKAGGNATSVAEVAPATPPVAEAAAEVTAADEAEAEALAPEAEVEASEDDDALAAAIALSMGGEGADPEAEAAAELEEAQNALCALIDQTCQPETPALGEEAAAENGSCTPSSSKKEKLG